MRAMADLQAEGKIKHIGLCGISSTALRRATAIAPVTAVQVKYSPFVRDIETSASTNLLATCRELVIAVVCHSPLGRGLLTGTISGAADLAADPLAARLQHIPWFHIDNIDANAKIVNGIKGLAEKKGCSAAQLALAWTLAQGQDILAISGTRKVKYLDDNWNALDVRVSDADEAEVRKFVGENELQGSEVNAQGKAFSYVDTKAES